MSSLGRPSEPDQAPELSEYEQVLRTRINSAAYQEKNHSHGKEGKDADILPRVRLERFLRRHRQPSASFSYVEERDAPNLPPTSVICNIRAAGRASEGRGESRFDATQQACHQWLQDYEKLHVRDKRTNEKLKGGKARILPAVYAPADAPWHELPTAIKSQKAVKAPWLAPVPELAHGLSRVLHMDNSKATPIWSKFGGKPASAYIRTIVQPKDINWEAIGAFVPPSFDQTLHELGIKHKAKYKVRAMNVCCMLLACCVRHTFPLSTHHCLLMLCRFSPRMHGSRHDYGSPCM